MREQWTGFHEGSWVNEIDVRDFIQKTIRRMRAVLPFGAGDAPH